MDKWWFFCNSKFLKMIKGNDTYLEQEPFKNKKNKKTISSWYKHNGPSMHGYDRR